MGPQTTLQQRKQVASVAELLPAISSLKATKSMRLVFRLVFLLGVYDRLLFADAKVWACRLYTLRTSPGRLTQSKSMNPCFVWLCRLCCSLPPLQYLVCGVPCLDAGGVFENQSLLKCKVLPCRLPAWETLPLVIPQLLSVMWWRF